MIRRSMCAAYALIGGQRRAEAGWSTAEGVMLGSGRLGRFGRGLVVVVSVLVTGFFGTLETLQGADNEESGGVTPAAYQPFEFLVGEWDAGVEGQPPAAVVRFRWGPHRTYLWYSGGLVVEGVEQPSYEGMLVWNGVNKNLDMLLALEQSTGGLVQEHGVVYSEPDGTVVREITVVYSEGEFVPPDWAPAGPGGARARFRHTFVADGPDTVRSAVLRDSGAGWTPSFPGSDRLILTRRYSRD